MHNMLSPCKCVCVCVALQDLAPLLHVHVPVLHSHPTNNASPSFLLHANHMMLLCVHAVRPSGATTNEGGPVPVPSRANAKGGAAVDLAYVAWVGCREGSWIWEV